MNKLLIRLCVFVAVLLSGAGAVMGSTCKSSPKRCSATALCTYASDYNYKSRIHVWSSYYTRHITEAKLRGLSCGVKAPPLSSLGKQFVAVSNEEKKTIQSNLAAKDYFNSAIDGLYGKILMLH